MVLFCPYLRKVIITPAISVDTPGSDLRFLGRIIHRFLEVFQFNTHMVEAVLGNRLIAPDAETRIWKDADKFAHGEFVENVRVGSGIYPTLVRYQIATLEFIFSQIQFTKDWLAGLDDFVFC